MTAPAERGTGSRDNQVAGSPPFPAGWLFRSDFVRKVAETFAAKLLLLALGLASSVILARILGPEGRGLYAVAVAVGGLGVQFGNLGLHASNTYLAARKPELLPALAGNSLVVSLVFGGLGAVFLRAAMALNPGLVRIGGLLLDLSLVWIPLGLGYLLMQNLLLGIHDVRGYNLIDVGNRLISLMLVGGVILLGVVGAESVFFCGLIALGASFLWALARLRVPLNRLPPASLRLFIDNLPYSLKAYAGALFAYLVLRADMLILQYLRGARETGYYSVAVAVADLLYLFPMIVGTILFPRLSAMPGDMRRWRYSRRVALVVGAIMAGLALGIWALAAHLVRLLYGPAFLPAVPALVWLLPGIVLLSVNTVLMNYFASAGMPPVTVWSPALAAAVNIVLNLELIPRLGIVGASLASSAAYGLMLACSLLHLLAGEKEAVA